MKISIIGSAGTVGSCTAYTIADQGLAEEIVMLDMKHNILMNHVMDIRAATVLRQNMIVRAGTYQDMSESDIVIISAGVHFPASTPVEEKLTPNVPIIKDIGENIEKYCPDAVVITASNPVDLLNTAMYLSTSLNPKKLLGFNLNDSVRFRMATASALGIQNTGVEAVVVGEHPKTPVLLFSSIKIDGKSYTADEAFKQRVRNEIRDYLKTFESFNAGRSAGWTSAAGLAFMVRAIAEDSRKIIPCSAIVNGEYGHQSISMGVPAIISKGGVVEILDWHLPPDEQKEVDEAGRALEAGSQIVRHRVGPRRR